MSAGTETQRQVTNVIAPKQSATPGIGVTILAATTAAASASVPEALLGSYVYLIAEGDKIWVSFDSTSATSIDKTKTGGATFVLGTDASNAIPIPDQTRIPVRLWKGQHDVIKWQSDSKNAKLIVYPTTPKAGI